jgi:hypothetical protein
LQRLQTDIGRENNALGQDSPTDVIWVISFLLIIRTIGILRSKSIDNSRPEENSKALARLLETYLTKTFPNPAEIRTKVMQDVCK